MNWKILAPTIASALLVASCLGSGQDASHGPALSAGDAPTAATGAPEGVRTPSDPSPDPGVSDPGSLVSRAAGAAPPAGTGPAPAASPGGRRVSLRPRNNPAAYDLLDHWGHRHAGLVSARLTEAPDPAGDVADLRNLLDTARARGAESPAPELRDGDAVAALGRRGGVAYGRWTGGPADTLSIEFDLENAPAAMRNDPDFRFFRAALERAGKVWSWRIEDTWTAWDRRAGESKGRLIGDGGTDGRELRVGPGGETSTGVVVHVTGVGAAGREAGAWGGPRILHPGDAWEPHTGAIAFVNDHVGEAGEATLFRTMAHEIGHVLGAWLGGDATARYAPFTDTGAGTWTGPDAVAVHGGPVPFQDAEDEHGWHDGERSPGASRFDYGHSGVCASVMAYCADDAAIPAFAPAAIDFAFLRDLGLTVREDTDRPETYGLAGWMEHAAFTLSVSRALEVSLADPQPRYAVGGARWESLETVDLLWAGADAFGAPSTGGLAASFPPAGTVRWSGGLIGAAVDLNGLPPVLGDAHLRIGLDSLAGKASFTSLVTLYDGKRYRFGDGSLHYPVSVAGNAVWHDTAGVSLRADFYGPGHDEVAGTLDDARAGLVASFGARHDARPGHAETVAAADHVRGLTFGAEGFRRYRCGAGPGCESITEWWEAGSAWREVSASGDRSPRDLVLDRTAGWGAWLSEDMVADHGAIRIARRHARATDGRRGRYQADGYFGTMAHAAFGAGILEFHEWRGADGGTAGHGPIGAGFQGDLSGSRPAGGAVWNGRMVGYQRGVAPGEDPFVRGHASLAVSFGSERLDILFSGVRSADLKRSLANFGFDDVPLKSDGTFEGFDRGHVEGAFFGPSHGEAAGLFQRNDNRVIGSFGAVRPGAGTAAASSVAGGG